MVAVCLELRFTAKCPTIRINLAPLQGMKTRLRWRFALLTLFERARILRGGGDSLVCDQVVCTEPNADNAFEKMLDRFAMRIELSSHEALRKAHLKYDHRQSPHRSTARTFKQALNLHPRS